MNATALPKPVMDVAAPKSPAPTTSAAPAKKVVSAALLASRHPVRPARPALALRKSGGVIRSAQAAPQQVPAPRAADRKATAPAQTPAQRRAPVALITVTVFAVLILSVLAVAAFVTFRMA